MSKYIRDLIFLHKNTCFKPIKGRYEIWLLDTLKCSVPWMATAPLGVCLVAQLRCVDSYRLAPKLFDWSWMVNYCCKTEFKIWAGFGSAWQFWVNEFSEFFIAILSKI